MKMKIPQHCGSLATKSFGIIHRKWRLFTNFLPTKNMWALVVQCPVGVNYPLVMSKVCYWKCPIYSCFTYSKLVIFYSFWYVYQRVTHFRCCFPGIILSRPAHGQSNGEPQSDAEASKKHNAMYDMYLYT